MKRIIILSACLAILGLALSCDLPGWGQPDNNANLSSLTSSHGSLSPVFSASTTAYTLNLDNSLSSVTIQGTPVSSNSTVSGPITLSELEPGIAQTATITVTAQVLKGSYFTLFPYTSVKHDPFRTELRYERHHSR